MQLCWTNKTRYTGSSLDIYLEMLIYCWFIAQCEVVPGTSPLAGKNTLVPENLENSAMQK